MGTQPWGEKSLGLGGCSAAEKQHVNVACVCVPSGSVSAAYGRSAPSVYHRRPLIQMNAGRRSPDTPQPPIQMNGVSPGSRRRRTDAARVTNNLGRERFCSPPPPGSNFRDCKCARIETTTSIRHPLWAVVVVVMYKIALPTTTRG